MLKILWKRGEIAPEEQFPLLSTIFCNLMLDFYVEIRFRFSLRDKRLFEITEVEIMRVDCSDKEYTLCFFAEIEVHNFSNISFKSEIKLKQQLEKISHMVKRFHKELQDIKPTPECKRPKYIQLRAHLFKALLA